MALSPTREELLRARLQPFTPLLRDLESGKGRAIHRTRVALRRLRELLPVLELEPAASVKLAHRLRRVTRRLGELRELDVLVDLAAEMGRDAGAGRAVRFVEDDIRRERDEARRRFAGKRVAAELARIARKLDKMLRAGRHRESTRSRLWAIDARVARRAATARKAVEQAGGLYLPDRLHVLRIAAKKLRYALELAVETRGGAPSATSADLRLLRQVQQHLGRLHDLQVLADRVRRIQASRVVAPLTPHDLAALLAGVEDDCRRVHARYVRLRARLIEVCGRHSGRGAVPVAVRKAG